jgi:hypothetical protein
MSIASARVFALCLALASLLTALVPPGASAQSRDRHDRRMVVVNDTGRTINAFHATNSGVSRWGRDLLGSDVIGPGQRYVFDFDDGTGFCMFDFRAVLDNGRPIERYRVNVCEYTSWIVR